MLLPSTCLPARAVRRPLLLLCTLLLGAAPLAAQPALCGSLANGYGPYDYRMHKDKLPVVEEHHFTPEVEALIRGSTSVQVGSDLDYTLLAFPNHHRALLAMQRLGQRLHTPLPPGAKYTVECYFQRALRFAPQDSTVHLLYAKFLFQNRRAREALAHMDEVDQDTESDALTHYNMGLIYLEQKYYDRARTQAHKAQELGLEDGTLGRQLEQLGQRP